MAAEDVGGAREGENLVDSEGRPGVRPMPCRLMNCGQWNEPRIFRMLRPGPPMVGHGIVATGSLLPGALVRSGERVFF